MYNKRKLQQHNIGLIGEIINCTIVFNHYELHMYFHVKKIEYKFYKYLDDISF